MSPEEAIHRAMKAARIVDHLHRLRVGCATARCMDLDQRRLAAEAAGYEDASATTWTWVVATMDAIELQRYELRRARRQRAAKEKAHA